MSFSDRLMRLAGLGEADGRPRAKVLAVAAQKGGVGKTTTAVNLGVALARFANQRTLLVDLDGQGHVAEALKRCYEDGCPTTLSDILLGVNRDVTEIVHATRVDLLSVTPSDKGLASAEGILAGRIGKEFLLRQALRRARERFDVIVLDCPPNLGNLTLNALMASDACLVPCDMSVLSLAGVADLLAVVETLRDRLDHRVNVLGILPTRVDRRNARMTQAVLQELADAYGPLVTRTHIPVSSALARAQMEGIPVFDFDPAATGATAYQALAGEVMARFATAGAAAA